MSEFGSLDSLVSKLNQSNVFTFTKLLDIINSSHSYSMRSALLSTLGERVSGYLFVIKPCVRNNKNVQNSCTSVDTTKNRVIHQNNVIQPSFKNR